ncbi:MAG: ABC transporter permease [Anaerolineae bacterium]|nr:ABC transporter permease [Anaerolineae bacterium]RIK21243.1 MAG: ABC transporter permease [Anaerolineae bacterium]
MDFENVLTLIQKELRDAFRNRWFLLYAAAFTGLSLALAWFSVSGAGSFGVAGFGRTTAGLINLILLIVPLMGLTLGAMSLAGEREKGTLIYLLAQPVSSGELLLGKFIGLALALTAALVIGFGLTGVLIVFLGNGGDFRIYLTLLVLSVILAIATLSMGFLISAAVKKAATAVGLALFLWLILVYFGDLGLMGTALVMQLDVEQLLAFALINPLQVFKIAAVLDLRDNLEVLGPAGIFAYRTYGGTLWPLLVGLLFAWVVVPFLIATQVFKKRGVL